MSCDDLRTPWPKGRTSVSHGRGVLRWLVSSLAAVRRDGRGDGPNSGPPCCGDSSRNMSGGNDWQNHQGWWRGHQLVKICRCTRQASPILAMFLFVFPEQMCFHGLSQEGLGMQRVLQASRSCCLVVPLLSWRDWTASKGRANFMPATAEERWNAFRVQR